MSTFAGWEIVSLPADDEGCCFYLDHYKPFRLAALKREPEAFGSTYNREINFVDDDWLNRIRNPLPKTFVAMLSDSKQILSATSLIGPLPNPDPASNPFQASSEMRDERDHHHNNSEASSMSFQITGVYTAPQARGQGLAKKVVRTATEWAVGHAKKQNGHLALSVIVYATNTGAIAFYESCGFVASPDGPKRSFNAVKNPFADEICMHYITGSLS
ncbi:uncharacterized protein F4822DRAFT_333636 [Hypoxylon trugodes]|uniref:uncharacterized protein n=1 Tax=Hypoxylon trugodes TaxID=326681 RepID=UPI0021A19CC2|nr:uncharacterized protein F4822DRAFT_333636 [Hypoxylon trugodes]KAI1387073.1 hypothetical protein F4822DRAFT_333636 [Hypoxylon trugodes]